jgi:hypothetical protein
MEPQFARHHHGHQPARSRDLIKFMLKKEADKMFEVSDPAIKKRVERAMAYIVELATSEGVPML